MFDLDCIGFVFEWLDKDILSQGLLNYTSIKSLNQSTKVNINQPECNYRNRIVLVHLLIGLYF